MISSLLSDAPSGEGDTSRLSQITNEDNVGYLEGDVALLHSLHVRGAMSHENGEQRVEGRFLKQVFRRECIELSILTGG
jgi:hypothetical protein